MSGKSKSSSASSNTSTNIDGRSVSDAQGQSGYATQNVRDSGVLTNQPITINGGGKKSKTTGVVTVNNTPTDFGAIAASFGFGKDVAGAGLEGYQDLLALTGDTFQAVFDIAKKNSDTVEQITSTTTEAIQKARNQELKAVDTNRYLVAAGIAIIGVVAVKVWANNG